MDIMGCFWNKGVRAIAASWVHEYVIVVTSPSDQQGRREVVRSSV